MWLLTLAACKSKVSAPDKTALVFFKASTSLARVSIKMQVFKIPFSTPARILELSASELEESSSSCCRTRLRCRPHRRLDRARLRAWREFVTASMRFRRLTCACNACTRLSMLWHHASSPPMMLKTRDMAPALRFVSWQSCAECPTNNPLLFCDWKCNCWKC